VEGQASDATARVLTWNLWWRFGPDWRARQDAIRRTIAAADPDVLALQEVWGDQASSQAHELAGRLGYVAVFAAPSLPPPPEPPESADQEGISVGLGLLSRWPILNSRRVVLPSRHRDPAPVALVAQLEHPAGPLHVVVACLEWEPDFDDDRHAQSQALADLATDPALDGPHPVVVAGDLNAAPDSTVLAPLRHVMTDAWEAGGGSPDAVTLPSTHPCAPLEVSELIDRRIDHIFVRDPRRQVTVTGAAVTGSAVDGVHPSDHLAVMCDLSWRTAG
jgi:endonuclease/exonuclease/phosphatase family metal-dependent hydrolase